MQGRSKGMRKVEGRLSGGGEDIDMHSPTPRLRQFLLTLSIAIYPLLEMCLCMLCLHTITPIGTEEPAGVAYNIPGLSVRQRYAETTALPEMQVVACMAKTECVSEQRGTGTEEAHHWWRK